MAMSSSTKIALGLGAATVVIGGVALASSTANAATPLPTGGPGSKLPPGPAGSMGLGDLPIPPGRIVQPPVPANGDRVVPQQPDRRVPRPAPVPIPRPSPKPKSKRPRKTVVPKPEPSDVPPPTGSSKDKMAGGTERRNAAFAVVGQPLTYAQRSMQKRDDQALEDWLTNVAYWDTYPNAPTKLDPKNKSHKSFIKAWARLREYVRKGLSLLPNLGKHPVHADSPDVSQKNWQRWALAVAFSSPLRTVEKLREGFRLAWHFVFFDKTGLAWQHKHIGKPIEGISASLEGLMADAAVYLATNSIPEAHRQLDRWPETLTKAFASAHNTMVKTK
jgi:hypothetical protein